jgi:acetate kinase
MAASLGTVDAVAFTGGIGEQSPEVRGAVADRLAFLGVGVDDAANAAAGAADADVSAPGAATATLVIHAREELVIARQTRELLS